MENLHIVSVIAVLKCKDRFLLVRRHEMDESFPGKWQNLGGKVEEGERIEEAIRREITEEVGLNINGALFFVQSYSWDKGDKSQKRLGLVFLVCLKGEPIDYAIHLCNELSEYRWATLNLARQFNKKGLLIGQKSPTGTFAQIVLANRISRLFRPGSRY